VLATSHKPITDSFIRFTKGKYTMSTSNHEFETTEIPLKKLLAWNENVRTTCAGQGINELAASIASVGLLQSLVVRKAPRGKFSVIAASGVCKPCPNWSRPVR
jgi:hypothetical protein